MAAPLPSVDDLAMIECDQLGAPVKMLERSCAARWVRAQRPKAEDRYRSPSFDICKHCASGAARAGQEHVPRPVRIEEPRRVSLVEARCARIMRFFEEGGRGTPLEVYAYLRAAGGDPALTHPIVRKYMALMLRDGRLAQECFGQGIYRHPAARPALPPVVEKMPEPTAQEKRARKQAAVRWMMTRRKTWRPRDMIAALEAEGHPLPAEAYQRHQIVGSIIHRQRRGRVVRIRRGVYRTLPKRPAPKSPQLALPIRSLASKAPRQPGRVRARPARVSIRRAPDPSRQMLLPLSAS